MTLAFQSGAEQLPTTRLQAPTLHYAERVQHKPQTARALELIRKNSQPRVRCLVAWPILLLSTEAVSFRAPPTFTTIFTFSLLTKNENSRPTARWKTEI